ncbi:hypothetical protein PMKS-002083 [Pichia membranifaciens]|uniref:Uncharacterized protein n=1 Tax=Pichia membranifaciens TaxID=4926 RepID=A0A1Q2YGB7_9ASCO|nr:hypothetical protein PMKS-002083 [Pichia membranifaciens]
MTSREEHVKSTDNAVDVGESIELRLKPQNPTFSFPDEGGKANDDVHTEKPPLSEDENQKEQLREEEGDKEEGVHNSEEAEEDKKHEQAGGSGESEDEVRRSSNANVKKRKPDPVSSIDARGLLKNIHNMKSLSEIDGTLSMSILSTLVDELIWLTDMLDKGVISDKDITENIFGDRVFDCVLDHFGEGSTQSNQEEKESDEPSEDAQNPENSERTQSQEKRKAGRFVEGVLNEILGEKLNHIDKKRLELISKSQEELGISFRKSSKILTNFEMSSKPSLSAADLKVYVRKNIGEYEKCSTDSDTLAWISNKFYLKSAPKMELSSYIDRINSHLEISGAVGLCAGWYLFKFLFNIKCIEKLSDGINCAQNSIAIDAYTEWESRCLPLVLGNSFSSLCGGESSHSLSDDLKVDGDSSMGSGNAICAQPMDNSFSSCSSVLNEDDSFTTTSSPNAEHKESNSEVHMSKISKLNAFRLILTCVRISSKLIEDKNFKQHYYCKVTGLQKLEDLFRLELALGYGLDWELFINEFTLWRYLFHMKALVVGCERLREKLAVEQQ